MRLWATVVFVLATCSSPPPASPGGPAPGEGAPYPMVDPDPALAALAVDFTGSCAFARPGSDAARYSVALRVTADAVVHDSAEFSGDGNRMGTIAAGARLAGEGPLAVGRGGGSGYGVVVRDSEGRVCRGYISAAAVSPETRRAREPGAAPASR